jgi:hypothetical protein
MGSGKTSAANVLWYEHGYIKLAFGDELRRMLAPSYGIIDKGDVYTINGRDMNGRELLQMSARVLRSLDTDIFLRAMSRTLKIYPDRMPIVVDDVRMPAEADYLREQGFELYILEADSATRQSRLGVAWGDDGDETEAILIEAPRISTVGITPQEVIRVIADERRG